MPGLSRRRRMLVLATCSMSLFIVGLDNTIVNVALPTMGRELDASVTGMQWTVDAYLLVLASLLMLAGSTADRIGRRRVFQAGLVLFVAGSALCAVAPSLGWLVVFRMVQAVGGSMLNPVAMSIITNTFTERRERARAIGVWGGVIGLSMALGPVAGGALVDSAGWRAIFWVNVPIGLAAVVLTVLFVPESKAPRARRLDWAGQLLVIVMLAGLTYAIIEGPTAGWTSVEILGSAGAALAALVGLVVYEPRRDDPLIELGFFRSVPFSGATVIAMSGFAALGGFLFLNVLYLQNVRGLSALEAGLYTMPMAAMTVVFAPLSGRLVARSGPRPSLVASGIALALSGALLSGFTATTPPWRLVVAYLVFGFGFAMLNAPITTTAVAGMPLAQAGVAAATASTSRQIGQSLGVAIAGSLLVAGAYGEGPSGADWWLITGYGLIVLVLGVVTTGPRATATAAKTAERFTTSEAKASVTTP